MEKPTMKARRFDNQFRSRVDRYLTLDEHTPVVELQKDNEQYRELVDFAARHLVKAKDQEEFLNRLKNLFFRPAESFSALPTPGDVRISNVTSTTQEEVTDFIIAVSARALSLQKESSKVSHIQERTSRRARRHIR